MAVDLRTLAAWLQEALPGIRLRRGDARTIGSVDELPMRSARSLTLDSRGCDRRTAFVAVAGERTHGVRFLEAAFAAGAPFALVEGEAPRIEIADAVWIEVDDGRRALAAAARAWLQSHHPQVIGITGSNGKTTTKDMVTAALAGRLRVGATPGNLNSSWGLPLAVLGMKGEEEVLVLEMGASAPGEIGVLAAIAAPRVGVITNIGPAHLESFRSTEEVARTKAQLVEALPIDGCAVLGCDDEHFTALVAANAATRFRSFGRSAGADVRIERVEPVLGGVDVCIQGTRALLPRFGEAHALNAAAALAVAAEFEIEIAEALERIARMPAAPHRGRWIEVAGGWWVDDAYNANPASMIAALHTLGRTPSVARRIAVLGDMAELGPEGPLAHRKVLESAREVGIDRIHTFGPLFASAAADAGVEVLAHATGAYEEFAAALDPHPRDLVLFKGSRSQQLERAIEAARGRTTASHDRGREEV